MPLLIALAIALQVPKVTDTHIHFVDGAKWRVEEFVASYEHSSRGVRVLRGSKMMTERTGGGTYDATFIHWPHPGRLVAITERSSMGHGMRSWLYRAGKDGLKDLGQSLVGEIGGPIFRDFDGEGLQEIVFDNYDYYETYDNPPTKLMIYKYRDGRLMLWRTYPNKHKVRLPKIVSAT